MNQKRWKIEGTGRNGRFILVVRAQDYAAAKRTVVSKRGIVHIDTIALIEEQL